MKREVSKRRQPFVRTAVYSFMTLTVAIIVALLMFVVLGYSFNEQDGKLEQGGLLQFSSVPSGATVTLDEVKLGSNTDTKATVDTGNHSVIYNRTGYREWRKSIYIDPGQIGWLNYARLIPKDILPQDLRTFVTISGALASPRQNYLLLHEAADQPTFTLVNIQGDTVRYTNLTLPAGSYTMPNVGKSQSFVAESWSRDENAVLVRHTYNDNQTEWLWMARNSPEKSINISTTFGITPSKVLFGGGGNRLIFVQTDDIVRRVNLDDQTLSRPLVTKAASFTVYDEKTIVYATAVNDKNQRTVGYAAIDIAEPQTIATYPADNQSLFADMGSYFNRRYVAILHGNQLSVLTGTIPTPSQKADLKAYTKQTIPAGAVNVKMSHNNRFVVTHLADGFATYDLELKKYDKTTWASQSASGRQLEWLDEYMLWTDYGGVLRFYEFDGGNQQNIMPVTEGLDVSLSPNGKYIYGMLKTDKGFELRRAKLILD